MKNKKNQANKQYFCIKIASGVLLCVLLLLFSLPVYAAEEQKSEVLVENYNMIEEYITLLGSEASYYSALDKDTQKLISTSVVSAINTYRKQLLDLQSHPDAATRSLEKEIKLAYAKGRAAGRLAWIYFYQRERLTLSDSLASLGDKYEKSIAEINAATDEAVLGAKSDVLCAELNNHAYSLLLRELSAPDDSLASSSIIAGGIEELSNISDSSLLGESQEALYSKVTASLALSRASDHASKELRSLFAIINPSEDYQSNPTVALFTYKLKNSQSIKAINDALAEALCELLRVDDSLIYSRIYVGKLVSTINEESAKASKDGQSLSVSAIFLNYPIERAKASAKDEIRKMIYFGGRSDELLDSLEREFNSDGGRIDLSASADKLECEQIRAKYMLDCYESYIDARTQINIALEPYSKQEQLALSEAIYLDGADALRKLEAELEFEKASANESAICAEKLREVVIGAKAERFLLDHAAVISAPLGELGAKDEIHLRHALDDYTKLEPSVASLLVSQINSIAVKYNSVLSITIRSMLADDALFLDLCEVFCKEIENLDRTSIADYYNSCDLILSKSRALSNSIRYYRELCASEIYSSFNASEREDLIEVCRNTAKKLSALSVGDKGIFADELRDISEDAKTDMWRVNERARVRVTARGSSNSEIKAIILEANAKMGASRDASEISSIADRAAFKINRLLTGDEIASHAENLKRQIEKMKFLRASEKELFYTKINDLCKQAKSEALVSENLTVLSFVWNSFCKSVGEIELSAKKSDLALARDAHLELFENEVQKLLEKLRTMSHLPASKSEEYSNKLIELRTSFKSRIGLAPSTDEVSKIYTEMLGTLHSIELSADSENLEVYKDTVKSKLDSLPYDPQNYSVENYSRISAIINEAKAELASAQNISACNEVLEDAKERIALVNDLLDDAIETAISAIEKQAEFYRSRANLYSSAALSRLEQIAKDAKARIRSYTLIAHVPDVELEAAQALRELAQVKCDYLTTLPDGAIVLQSGASYPANYSFANGYWGVLYSQNSLPSNSKLSILPASVENLRDIEKAIRKAAKRGEFKTLGASPNQSTLKELKHAKVALALDISLSDTEVLTSVTELKLLLPEEYSREKILGIAFVDSENNVEYYNISQEEFLISFSPNHFSNYYIVVENTINLMPLIVFLATLITLEFILFIFILILRFNRKRKENDEMLPLLNSCFLPLTSFSLTQIKPSGALTTTVLLSVAALALGCAVALLARLELREYRASKHKAPVRSAPPAQPLLRASTRNALPERRAALKAAENTSGEDSYYPDYAVAVEDREPLSDEDLEQIFDVEVDDAYTCFGKARHKAEINLDVIEEKFEDGDLVTLDALKRKKLVPKRTDYVKILARGALTKPLIIEANDFSRAAEEMLTALGGEAIRVRH